MLRVLVCLGLLYLATQNRSLANDAGLRDGSPEEVGIAADVLAMGVEQVRQSVNRGDIHGAVLFVAREGRIVLHQAVGWRNVEGRVPMEQDTLFKMASNTKPVIAAAD